MKLEELIHKDKLNENIFNKYIISNEASKLIYKLKKRRNLILKDNLANDEDKKIAKVINKVLPIMENFEKYFVKIETDLYNTNDEEKKKLIEAKYNDIKILFIDELYKVMESVSYKPSILIIYLISWIILILATPFSGWLLVPTYFKLRNININKKKITNRNFARELNKLLSSLEQKKRKQYRSYKQKEVL